MITLTDAQIRALHHANTNGAVRTGQRISRATINVLKNEGFIQYTNINYRSWEAQITDAGRRWLSRYGTPEAVAAAWTARAMRTEYRDRAATYLRRVRPVLERLTTRDYHVYKALEVLNTVSHPGKAPGRVEDCGWWLQDNNSRGGWAYDIGGALVEIGENCAHNAFPIDSRAMDRLGEFETTLAEARQEMGMTEVEA